MDWRISRETQRLLIFLILLAGLSFVLFGLIFFSSNASSVGISGKAGKTEIGITVDETSEELKTYQATLKQLRNLINSDYLRVVDSEHAWPESLMLTLKMLQYDSTVTMAIDAANAMDSLLSDAVVAGYQPKLTVGYRSAGDQKTLYNTALLDNQKAGYSESESAARASASVGKPNCNEHQTGLACDFSSECLTQNVSGVSFRSYLESKMADYGFIASYGGNESSASNSEDYHIRYVGSETAKDIMHYGFSLSEYSANLQSQIKYMEDRIVDISRPSL